MMQQSVEFETWQETVHDAIRQDPLWKFVTVQSLRPPAPNSGGDFPPKLGGLRGEVNAYKSLYAYDRAWDDCDFLLKDVRGQKIAGQLIRSVGSISANIEEGFGRGS